MDNTEKQPYGGYLLAALATAAFTGTALLVGADRVGPFDRAVIRVVQGWESTGLTVTAEALSWIGSMTTVIALTLLLAIFMYAVLKHRKELVLFAAAIAGAGLLNKLLKVAFQRERPDIHPLVVETGYSFPSGHTMGALALYGILVWLLWRHVASPAGKTALIAVCALMYLGIAVSRIYLGVHYPSDIAGGTLASAAWLGLCIGVYERRIRKPAGYAAERQEAA